MTEYDMRISDWGSDVCSADPSPVLVAGALASVRNLKSSAVERAAQLDAQAVICRGQAPGYAVEYPYRPAPGRRSGEDETYQRHPACRIRDLCPADQLSDSAARHRAASLHAGSDPQSRDDAGPHECAD